jgi:hypothetical protein
VQVHQVIYNAGLEVVVDLVDDDLSTNIHNLDICEVLLVALRIYGLIDLLVVADAIPKVEGRSLGIGALVVGRGGLDLEDVGHDERLVVAAGLDIQRVDALLGALVVDPASAHACRVRGVEDGNGALTASEPLQHVSESSLSRCTAHLLARWVVGVEEVGGRLWGVGAAVGANIEDLCLDGEPFEVSCHCDSTPVSVCVNVLGHGCIITHPSGRSDSCRGQAGRP